MANISQISLSGVSYTLKDTAARGDIATLQGQVGSNTLGKSVPSDALFSDTWVAMVGANSTANGTAGYVPAPPSNGYSNKYLRADGTWAVVEQITVDSSITQNGTNPVQGSAIYSALADKADSADLGSAAAKDIVNTYSSTSEDAISGKGVAAALATLPTPMVFKGSLGTEGTISSLPAAASGNNGYVYKVITDGTYQGVAAEVGDVLVSNGSSWVLIPAGDEPSGTVTSVGISSGTGISVSGGPVTTSGSITVAHADTSSQATVTNSGRTYIQSITLDGMGHVTGISSGTESVTDTHYASSTIVGGSSSAKANAAVATNGNVYLNHIENGSVVSSHNIAGSGIVSVTSDANGKITISGTAPSYSAGTGLSLSGTEFSLGTSGVTAGSYGPASAVTGSHNATMNVPYITVDSYGRVTSISNTVYTAQDNNTTYTFSTGLTNTSGTITLASHASANTTYGIGTDTNYGHVKLSDSYMTSGGSASSGVAASSKAVYDCYTALSASSSGSDVILPIYSSSATNTPTTNGAIWIVE